MFYIYFTGLVITPVTRFVAGVVVCRDRSHATELVTDSCGVVLSTYMECQVLGPAQDNAVPRVLAFGDDPELINKP